MKIPDDVFENRCRYCYHGRPENGNEDVPDSKLFVSSYSKQRSCGIQSISKCAVVEGECLSFFPNYIFGICATCAWSNMFHDGYCTRPSGPTEKRRVFLGSECLESTYWQEHRLSTCNNYKVHDTLKDIIMRDVIAGRSPANFDPDTWLPLTHMECNPAAARWQAIQEEAQRVAAENAKELEAKRAAAIREEEPQMSLF